MRNLVGLLLSLVLSLSAAQAQINVLPVNNGTGNLVSIPIPGGSGLSVTVGTGSAALPLQGINNNPSAVNITSGDDDFRNVPIGFDFPFYGRSFNNSWAMTNGLVSFQDPNRSGLGGACCDGVDLRTTTDPRYNYSIYALHSDLFSPNGQNQYYLRGENEMTYGWYGVSQCCGPQGGNNFEIKINSLGLVDTRIAGAMVSGNRVTSGMSGDLSKGEFYQYYHGSGLNITSGSTNVFSWQALSGTGAFDICTINPLSSPSCAGYQAAYTIQQCTISALHDPSCPGYAAAFSSQQCLINPLFSETCVGYQQAYQSQQCTLNSLYSTDCPGYAAAHLNQQCSLDPLYSTTCPGYAVAYFNQQCSLNGLYDKTCPTYSTAYATKMLLEQQGMASTVATAGVIARNAPTPMTTNSSGEFKVALVADSNVNDVITSRATSASPAQSATATVPLAPPPPPPPAPPQERKPEGGDKPAGNGPAPMAQAEQGSGSKEQPKTARQEIQAKRQEAARAKAAESGKQLANDMGKAADMESQKQVQNVVIQAMGFTPGFDAYGKAVIPDGVSYRPFTVYNNQKNIDNRATLRMFGGTDKLHNEMVDSQYNKGK